MPYAAIVREFERTSRGPFGPLLKSWRTSRHLTQLQLALEAGVSQRHVGFLEGGRAKPSREMVLILAEALSVPLREQNIMLQAAGFAPIFRETDLAAPEMVNIRTALELILKGHEPFGAVALTHGWDVVMANRPQALTLTALVGRVMPPLQVLDPPRPNLLRLLFAPTGLRQALVNWESVARETLHRARRDALWARDAALEALVRELGATLPPERVHNGLSDAPSARTGLQDASTSAVLPVEVHHNDGPMRFVSTLTTLGAPQDVTLQELRVEAFYPADVSTERRVREAFKQLVAVEP